MAPNDPDPLLGSIYAEISLEEYANALQLVREFERKHGETHALEIACGVLSRQMKLAHRTNPQRIIDPNTRLHGSR